MQLVETAEDESIDRLGREVALALIPALQLVETRPHNQLARQHSRRAQRSDNIWDVDDWMSFVVPREELLVVGLEVVIQLLLEAFAQLVDERACVKAWKRRPRDPRQQA